MSEDYSNVSSAMTAPITASGSQRTSPIEEMEDETIQALLAIQRDSAGTQTPYCLPEHNNNNNAPVSDKEDVLAYAKLSGYNWHFYINKLSVVIGKSVKESNDVIESQQGEEDDVDLHLGFDRSVAARHARVEYNFIKKNWEIAVIDDQALVSVNDQVFDHKSAPVALRSGDRVSIGNVMFAFLLPDNAISNQHTAASKRQARKVRETAPEPQPDPEYDENEVDEQEDEYSEVPTIAKPSRNNSRRQSAEKKSSTSRKSTKDSQKRNRSRVIQLPRHADGLDFKSEKADRQRKPPYSYASLIAEAITSVSERKMTLNKIYAYIQEHYAYYRHTGGGWQNSVRHNLSLNDAFIKLPRGPEEYGKGMYWSVDMQFIHDPDRKITSTSENNYASGNQMEEDDNECVTETNSVADESEGHDSMVDIEKTSSPANIENVAPAPTKPVIPPISLPPNGVSLLISGGHQPVFTGNQNVPPIPRIPNLKPTTFNNNGKKTTQMVHMPTVLPTLVPNELPPGYPPNPSAMPAHHQMQLAQMQQQMVYNQSMHNQQNFHAQQVKFFREAQAQYVANMRLQSNAPKGQSNRRSHSGQIRPQPTLPSVPVPIKPRPPMN